MPHLTASPGPLFLSDVMNWTDATVPGLSPRARRKRNRVFSRRMPAILQEVAAVGTVTESLVLRSA